VDLSSAATRISASDTIKRLPFLFGIFTFFAVVIARSRILQDPDLYLHVAIGRWIIAHWEVPHSDVFSFSFTGLPWVAHEWLSGVISAYLHDTLGWAGLLLLTALCFASAMGLLLSSLTKDLGPGWALIGTILAAGLAYPHLFARPHAFVLPLLVAWTSILVDARKRRTAPSPSIALLITLWANLHGSYIVGEVLIVLFALEAILENTDRKAALLVGRSWGIAILMSILAAFATPNLVNGTLLPFRLMNMRFMMTFIEEWRSPDFQGGHPLEFWLMLVLFGALTAGIKLPPMRLAMSLLFLHFALLHSRNSELLGLVIPIILAPSLGPQLRRFNNNVAFNLLARLDKPATAAFIFAFSMIILCVSVIVVRVGVDNKNREYAPTEAVEFAAKHQISGPVFNEINFGDYLLYSGIPPFIDGRVDMYGDDFLRRYADVSKFPEITAQYKMQWAVLNPKSAHVALLNNLAGWDKAFQDDVSIVYVKTLPRGGQ
jgi:hypothetical protein